MEIKLNTPLTTEEIEFRVQSINNGGYATILAYKDARVDMNRLDAVFGVGFWQRKHNLINGNLFCSVGIWNKEINQWVWVEDVGVESNAEKEKGQASDSFKRACFNLGIGRELYEYPTIQVKLFDNEWEKASPRPKATWDLRLKDWKWYSEFNEQGKLTYLGAKDQNGKLRFQWGNLKQQKNG